MELQNKIAVVTGGASGLGLEISNSLQAAGSDVVVLDKNEAALEGLHNNFQTYAVDVTDQENVVKVISTIVEEKGRIDILINNAGVIYNNPLINIMNRTSPRHDFDEFKKMIDINLSSVFLVGSVVAEKMVFKRTKGVIINTSSITAQGNAGQSAYTAAKAGVNALTKTWSKELGPLGIRVNAIAPGFIDTTSTQKALNEKIIDDLKAKTPLRRLGSPTDVAKAVLMIIENDYLTGTIINIDGGISI